MAASELNAQETLRRWIEEKRIDGLGDRYVRYLGVAEKEGKGCSV